MATDLALPDPSDAAALAKWLRDLRARAGLTQQQLAEAIGETSTRNIQRWESEKEKGRTTPSADDLLRMFSALGVEVKGLRPDAIPAAVNAELASLREAMAQMLAMLEARPQLVGEQLLRLLAEDPAALPPERLAEVAEGYRRVGRDYLLTADRLDGLATRRGDDQEDQGL